MPETPNDPQQAFSRTINHADKLAASLAELDAAGGLKALAGEMRPGSIDRLASALREIRAAIDGQLAGLKARQKPKVARATAPTPAPIQVPPASEADARPIRRAPR
jgi:hypothetical protein